MHEFSASVHTATLKVSQYTSMIINYILLTKLYSVVCAEVDLCAKKWGFMHNFGTQDSPTTQG